MSPDKRRLLIVGWDGADYDYLLELAGNGATPVFSRLLESGRAAPLFSTVPPISPAAWVSFGTGLAPGEHGVFSFYRRPPGTETYRRRPIPSDYWSDLSIWSSLDRRGIAQVLLNVPMVFPPIELRHGACVSGLGAPGDDPSCLGAPGWVGPELARNIPGYIPDVSTVQGTFSRAGLVQGVRAMVETRVRAAHWLMDRVPWQVFFVVFTAPDRLEHELWKFHDSAHPGHRDAGWKTFRHAVPDLYRRLDEVLGTLVERLREQDTVLVLSDHGFGPLVREFYVNRWLEQEGWLVLRAGSPLARGETGPDALVNSVDWSQTGVYSMGHLGELFLNLRGREPGGIVEPGPEADALKQAVADRLMELRDERGKPFCDWVRFGSDLFPGSRRAEAPDIVFAMRDYRIKGYMTGRGFEFQDRSRPLIASVRPEGRSGEHREKGVALASGPWQELLVPGARRIWELGREVAACYGLEASVPKPGTEKSTPRGGANVYTAEEEAAVRERLRRLGYLE